jgi:L-lactate dehydrogenase (cytochrome)
MGGKEMSISHMLKNVKSLEDLDSLAKSYLPRALWEFGSVGVEYNLSRDANRNAFDDIWLQPRVLNDVSDRSISHVLFGETFDAPFGIAPMGASAMLGFEADLNFARAANKANIPYVMSGSALIPMEKIAATNPDVWFQAYVDADRGSIVALADRVWNAGIRNLVITVDVPVPGNRSATLRKGFEYPIRPYFGIAIDALSHPRWLVKTFLRTLLSSGLPHIENYGPTRGIPIISFSAPQRDHVRDGLNWEDMKWLRERWQGRLMIKGVLSGADAKIAGSVGLDGIFVSNHGGRQLDTAVTPLKVLAEIVAEKGDMVILFDGGIRRGTDVIKALALGADFVFVGRPFLYAAALGEEAGVSYAISLLTEEIDRTIALLGCYNLDKLSSRVI